LTSGFYACFRNKCLKYWWFDIQHIITKCLNMKLDGGCYISKNILITITLPHHDTFESLGKATFL